MKKILSVIAVLACIVQTAFAEAPELKNMMPNSWQKLTRLSEQEEKNFFTNKNVKEDLSYRQNYYNGKKNKEIDIKIYYEKCGSILFYRVLYCNENLNDFFNIEYKNCTITQEEYEYWQDIEMLQSLYIKGKKNDLKFIGGVGFHTYWASQGEWEGFEFSDIMIKKLNENEIGFFVTEAKVSFYIERIKNNKKNVIYRTINNQQVGFSCTYFRKYKLTEEIQTTYNNDSITIDASHYLFDPKSPLKYSIQNAFDGNPATSYVENTEDDMFNLEIRGIQNQNITGLLIINGYASSSSLYKANNRMADYQYNSKGKGKLINNLKLRDNCLDYQKFNNCFSNDPFSITSGITKIYAGEKYNDTCLAEYNLICNNGSLLFGEVTNE